jgi:hypothetical protein
VVKVKVSDVIAAVADQVLEIIKLRVILALQGKAPRNRIIH